LGKRISPPSCTQAILMKSLPAIVAALCLASVAVGQALPPPAQRKVDYVRDVQPLFAKACYSCHGPIKQKSDFRLDVKASALKGGDRGAAIVSGKSAESPLIHFVAGLKEGM